MDSVFRLLSHDKRGYPVGGKLLLTLRPYAYGEDVYMDDISGNLGEDVVVEWRERYGEDVPIVAYMIPESMQAEMFAILGEGLWFDAEGTAKQVNIIELAQSPEINLWAVWYRLDAAAGLGNREVLFYDPDLITVADVAKISSWFKDPAPSALSDAILYYDAEADTDRELTGGPSTFNSSILGTQYRCNADGTYTAVSAGGPIVDTFDDGFVGLRSCGEVANLAAVTLGKDPSATLTNGWYDFAACVDGGDAVAASYSGSLASDASKPFTGFFICEFLPEDIGKKIKYLIKRIFGTYVATTGEHTIVPGLNTLAPLTFTQAVDGYGARLVISKENDSGYATIVKPIGWMITQSSYPTPYVPPGVTQPASNATASGGNWFTNTDGSPLWQSLDGEPDGVELVTNGHFDVDTAGWETLTSNTTLSYSSGEAVSERTGPGALDAALLAKNLSSLPAGQYMVEFEAYSSNTSTQLKCSFSANNIPGTGFVTFNALSGDKKVYGKVITKNVGANYILFSADMATGNIVKFDNISIQRIQPQPITLATRVKMGVGSGDYATTGMILSEKTSGTLLYGGDFGGLKRIVQSYDGVSGAFISGTWTRNSVVRLITQVNTAGTQFRVGYMIEGTHTTIQWSALVTYDGSFNPSTLYRLMIGYNNARPMWLNKLAVWKRQVSDNELLEVFS